MAADHPIDEEELRPAVLEMMQAQWRPEGYTMPNADTYPWQWLWDSCFHAVVWADLGDDRGLTELDRLFVNQTPRGFVPHMNYHPDPGAATDFWGRPGSSNITQPPMYGWALAELARMGLPPSDELVDRARRGLGFLFRDRRRSSSGLIELCHPWESGCDDSARWDNAIDGPWDVERWRSHKTRLVGAVRVDDEGGAVANDAFGVASVGFNALVAFNAMELGTRFDDDQLLAWAGELASAISQRFDPELGTWIDAGPLAESSGRARTTDALFALLVDPEPAGRAEVVVGELLDDGAYGGACGPAGAHRDEPTFDPHTYWRGPAWPQMTCLLAIAVDRLSREQGQRVWESLLNGACRSGLAEYWHPDTGAAGGARPQSWAGLGLLAETRLADPSEAEVLRFSRP